MTEAPKLSWPQDTPLFETSWRAISEALRGNAILAAGDLAVAPTANVRELEVAAGTAWYGGTEATLSAASTVTLSAGDADNDRWDTIAFDTNAEAVVTREGTASTAPEPPDVQTDEILLAVVYTPAEFDDVYASGDVHNWRGMHQGAGQVRLEDADGHYTAGDVEAAFDEAVDKFLDAAGDTLEGTLSVGEDPGAFGAVVDASVSGDSAQGNTHSYTFSIDGTALITLSAESDGSGGIQNVSASLGATLDTDGNDIEDGSTTVWDSANEYVPSGSVEWDLGTDDLTSEDGTHTVYDNTEDNVPRARVDDHKATTTVTSASYTTADEEVVLVDTATIAGASTITLASADAEDGNTIVVSDLTGSAGDYPITVDTEGSETIHGQSSKLVETTGGALVFTSDGTNWALGGGGAGGGGADPTNVFEGREGGEVAAGDQGIVVVDHLPDGETLEVYKAALTTAAVEAAPTDLNLELVTFDNSGGYTVRESLISGDGSTVFDRETGDPLASYTNTSGGGQSVGVIADNATGAVQEIIAVVEGETNA